jgi:hypothetical protein
VEAAEGCWQNPAPLEWNGAADQLHTPVEARPEFGAKYQGRWQIIQTARHSEAKTASNSRV